MRFHPHQAEGNNALALSIRAYLPKEPPQQVETARTKPEDRRFHLGCELRTKTMANVFIHPFDGPSK